MRVQNISWKSHPTKTFIYNSLPPISSLVQSRRVQFAGHCCRAEQEIISDLLLWKPPTQNKRGRKLTFPDVISRDTGLKQEDLRTAMMDREFWRGMVESIVSTAVEQWWWWWCIKRNAQWNFQRRTQNILEVGVYEMKILLSINRSFRQNERQIT